LETLLRIHPQHQWYDLSDPAMEDAVIEVTSMRQLAGIALISEHGRVSVQLALGGFAAD
jgi:IS5 family transposase